ncbi:MAG TPA: 4-hydroxy-tetrahydrodipicolinate reductase [Thermomicrobiales bacterium]|nr:4-hydroxy-tetrahydrodipicolinate reductase [Thermomicrobiales bacterium]
MAHQVPAPGIQPLRLGIVGIAGRMGREIIATAESDPEVRVIGGTLRPGNAASRPPPDIAVHESLAGLLPLIDVVIDFSTPASSVETARQAATANIPAVIGTTGLTAEQIASMRAVSARIPVWYARNMSTGIGTLLRFLPEIARALEGYDIELIEAHHRHKVDAPSGTALALVDAIRSGLPDNGREHPLVHGRQGHSPRQRGEIGIHAVRGGGNAGEHEVIFASGEEEIRISHRAYNRGAFAAGAIRAAKRIVTLPPGWHGPG